MLDSRTVILFMTRLLNILPYLRSKISLTCGDSELVYLAVLHGAIDGVILGADVRAVNEA